MKVYFRLSFTTFINGKNERQMYTQRIAYIVIKKVFVGSVNPCTIKI